MSKPNKPYARARKRDTQTQEKELAVYLNYKRVISKHGIHAKNMNKHDLYEETARPFFIHPDSVQRIISKMIKNPPQVSKITVEEVTEGITLVETILDAAKKS